MTGIFRSDWKLAKVSQIFKSGSKTLFTWSGGPQSSGVGFFCFHALGNTKQKQLTPLDRGPLLHVNSVQVWPKQLSTYICYS